MSWQHVGNCRAHISACQKGVVVEREERQVHWYLPATNLVDYPPHFSPEGFYEWACPENMEYVTGDVPQWQQRSEVSKKILFRVVGILHQHVRSLYPDYWYFVAIEVLWIKWRILLLCRVVNVVCRSYSHLAKNPKPSSLIVDLNKECIAETACLIQPVLVHPLSKFIK